MTDWGGPTEIAGPFKSLASNSGGGLIMSIVRLSAAALVAMSMAACAGNPETGSGPNENTGTLVGAVAGGLIGSQFGGGTGERVAAGLAGAAIGGLIGNRMDDEDKQRAYAAQMQALEGGRSGAAVHPHHLYRRQAAGGARQRLPQSGRHLDCGELIYRLPARVFEGAKHTQDLAQIAYARLHAREVRCDVKRP